MSASNSLRGRVPGQSVLSEIVARQAELPPRSGIARLFGVSPLAAENRALYRAAIGELLVGDTVAKVGSDWDVVHDVHVSAGQPAIDHLLIGPAGVFTIRTRNFPGQEIWVAGNALVAGADHSADIAEAREDADVVATMLSDAAGRPVEVTPVVVLVNPKKLVIREQPKAVEVVTSRDLAGWLAARPRTLDGTDVAFISDVADRSTTWATQGESVEDTSVLHGEFQRLRETVTRAASLRVFWGGIAFVIAAGFTWISVALFVSRLMTP